MFNLNDMMCQECTKRRGESALTCAACLDYLNWCRVMIEPWRSEKHPDLYADFDLQQKIAIEKVSKDTSGYIDELDTQTLFIWYQRFVGLSAAASLLYNQKVIKERIPDVDRVERAKSFSEAIERQKMEQRPKVEKKQLDARGKAIAAMMAVGMSETDATESVDRKFKSVGKVTA